MLKSDRWDGLSKAFISYILSQICCCAESPMGYKTFLWASKSFPRHQIVMIVINIFQPPPPRRTIGIIISENVDNYGRPLKHHCEKLLDCWKRFWKNTYSMMEFINSCHKCNLTTDDSDSKILVNCGSFRCCPGKDVQFSVNMTFYGSRWHCPLAFLILQSFCGRVIGMSQYILISTTTERPQNELAQYLPSKS